MNEKEEIIERELELNDAFGLYNMLATAFNSFVIKTNDRLNALEKGLKTEVERTDTLAEGALAVLEQHKEFFNGIDQRLIDQISANSGLHKRIDALEKQVPSINKINLS